MLNNKENLNFMEGFVAILPKRKGLENGANEPQFLEEINFDLKRKIG